MLNPALQQLNIAQLGERIEWWRAYPCSCYDPATNYDAQEECEACERGFVYRLQEELRGIVHRVRREMVHPDFGMVQVGDLLLTTMPSDMTIANWDRIVLLEREFEVWDRLVRGERDTITNAGSHIVEIVTVGDQEQVYEQGADWTFTPPNTITWLGADAPVGIYSVLYRRNPAFWFVGSERTGGRPTRLSDVRLAQTGKLVVRREEGP